MPLDPRARQFLDQLNASGMPPLENMSAPEARLATAALLAMQGEPQAVATVENRRIPGPSGELPIRVYTPTGGPHPVVVYFHGGGWVIGDLESHDGVCRALANGVPATVVSVDYRLAPEHRFPAAADDCWAATRWVAEHGAALGDVSRIAVGGDSAGGNLAAVVSLMARDRGGPRIAYQLLVYPVTDASLDTPSYRENADGYLLTRSVMEWFWNHYTKATDRESPYASPLRARDLKGLPPALVITAEFDPLRDEGEAYARRLEQAGVPVKVRRFDGMIHGFFGMGAVFPQAATALQEAVAGAAVGVAGIVERRSACGGRPLRSGPRATRAPGCGRQCRGSGQRAGSAGRAEGAPRPRLGRVTLRNPAGARGASRARLPTALAVPIWRATEPVLDGFRPSFVQIAHAPNPRRSSSRDDP